MYVGTKDVCSSIAYKETLARHPTSLLHIKFLAGSNGNYVHMLDFNHPQNS